MNRKGLFTLGLLVLCFFGYRAFTGIMTTDAVVAEARLGTAIKAVNGTVTVLAEVETELLSTAHGFIQESHLRDGMAFNKGDVLAIIDPGSLPFLIESAKAEIKSLRAEMEQGSSKLIELRTAERELEPSKALAKAGHISKEEYEKLQDQRDLLKNLAETETKQMEAALEVKKNSLAELEDRLSRLTIKAPMDGRISKIMAYPGDLVSVGGTLAEIISKDLKISAEVNQDDIEAIREKGRADVRFFAFGNRLFPAEVRKVLPSSDSETQRFTVYLDLLKQPDGMLSGLTGEASFFADERTDAVLIPRQALIGNTVFVVNGSMIERRVISPGYLTYSDAEILSGLEVGERVIAEDVDFFRDGDRINVVKVIGED